MVAISTRSDGTPDYSTFQCTLTMAGRTLDIQENFTRSGAVFKAKSRTAPMFVNGLSHYPSSGASGPDQTAPAPVSGRTLVEAPGTGLVFVFPPQDQEIRFYSQTNPAQSFSSALNGAPVAYHIRPDQNLVYFIETDPPQIESVNMATRATTRVLALTGSPAGAGGSPGENVIALIYDSPPALKLLDLDTLQWVHERQIWFVPAQVFYEKDMGESVLASGSASGLQGVFVLNPDGSASLIQESEYIPAHAAYDPDTDRLAWVQSSQPMLWLWTRPAGPVQTLGIPDNPSTLIPVHDGVFYLLADNGFSLSRLNTETRAVSLMRTFDLPAMAVCCEHSRGLLVLEDLWDIPGQQAATLTASILDKSGRSATASVRMNIARSVPQKPLAANGGKQ